MKKTYRIVPALLAALLLLSLAACGTSGKASSTDVESPATASSTDITPPASQEPAPAQAALTLVTEGKLTMGTNAEFPPYEYYEGNKVVGIDAEIAAAIAGKLGWNWSSRI
jgi:polar amino acid transport system substrate-binding protein